jgi:hypothetical protein
MAVKAQAEQMLEAQERPTLEQVAAAEVILLGDTTVAQAQLFLN